MTPLIETEQLCKTFHPGLPDEMQAVKSVSLQVFPGELLVLQGPSGSGKTSLLSLIGCMARPTSGRLRVLEQDVARLPEPFLTRIRRETFGFIFQQFNLLPDLTLLDNLRLPLYPTDLSAQQMQQRADDLLQRLNLSEKQQQPVKRLSGGEQQRVAIARALINQPQILIADEPTAHLDRKLSEELLQIFATLKQQGKTLIVASHDPLVCQHPLVDRCLSMEHGRLLAEPE